MVRAAAALSGNLDLIPSDSLLFPLLQLVSNILHVILHTHKQHVSRDPEQDAGHNYGMWVAFTSYMYMYSATIQTNWGKPDQVPHSGQPGTTPICGYVHVPGPTPPHVHRKGFPHHMFIQV